MNYKSIFYKFDKLLIPYSFVSENKGFGKVSLQFSLKHAKETLQVNHAILTS